MRHLLTQIVLGRNEDVESWMNILVVVVLAVFWAVGGILKAKSKSAQTRKEGQPPPGRARRPSVPGRASQEQLPLKPDRRVAPVRQRPARPGTQPLRTKLAQWRAAAEKFGAEADQAFRVQLAEPATPPREPATKPTPTSPPPISPPAAKPLAGPLEKETQAAAMQASHAEYLTRLLADYSDPDQLRRAILHYEILGRPLSLRDADESAIGL